MIAVGSKTARLVMLGFLFGVSLVAGIASGLPDSRLHVVACDVGQGDAILVSIRSSQVLVDGGPGSQVLECLSRQMPFWDRTLEVVVLTHPQADHLSGLVSVFERYDVEQMIVNGLMNDTAGFRALREAVVAEGVSVHLPQQGDQIRLEPLVMTVVWPKKKMGLAGLWTSRFSGEEVLGAVSYQGDLNETSVVLRLSFGNFDAFLGGDIGFPTEEALVADDQIRPVEVLKVGHHGSKYASSSDFLEALDPGLAIISVGERNRYGHPTSETLERLAAVGAKVVRTDISGDIAVVSDGDTYWLE